MVKSNIIICGASAAGKSSLAEILANIGNADIYEIGSIVKEKSGTSGLSAFKYVDVIFSKYGYEYFVEIFKKKHGVFHGGIIVGPRTASEVNFLKENFYPAISIGLLTNFDLRAARHKNRIRHKESEECFEDWLMRDMAEHRWGVEEAVKSCDVVFDGGESLSEIARKILRIWGG